MIGLIQYRCREGALANINHIATHDLLFVSMPLCQCQQLNIRKVKYSFRKREKL